MPMSFNSKVMMNKMNCGVQVMKNSRVRLGMRLNPYCEIHDGPEELKKLQEELLEISVTSALRPKFLRISGVENCYMMTSFIKDERKTWFLTVMLMFKRGEHLTRKGMLKILELRPTPKNKSLRIKPGEIIQTIME